MKPTTIPTQCKIGYGLLLEGKFFNMLRNYELDVYHAIGEHQGLNQPPHITIKRPFTISSTDLGLYINLLERYASLIPKIDIIYGPIERFPNGTAFVRVDGRMVNKAHDSLLGLLRDTGIEPDEFEGRNFIPHATIALEFDPHEDLDVQKALNKRPFETGKTSIGSVGIFLNVDAKHWIVIATQKLVIN